MAALSLWYVYDTQRSVNYTACSLCDGKQYLASYQYFNGQNATYQVKFPFHSRVGVPWLAAQLSSQAYAAFAMIHWVGVFLTVIVLLFCWQVLKLPGYLKAIGIGWLLLHWIGIVRFNVYDPVTVDILVYVFHSVLLALLLRPRWFWLLLVVTPIATAQKESWLALMALLTLYELLYQRLINLKPAYRKLWILAGALLIAVLTKVLLNQWFPPMNGAGKNSVITLLFFIRETLQNPLDLVRWVVAMFVGFGVWWCLAWQSINRENIRKNLPESAILYPLILLAGAHLLLGILAGRDMTRIMFLGYPFIMTLVLLMIQSVPKNLLIFTGLLSLPMLRLWSEIPLQTTAQKSFKLWFPEYAPLGEVSAWAVYMIISYWLIHQTKRWWPLLVAKVAKNKTDDNAV